MRAITRAIIRDHRSLLRAFPVSIRRFTSISLSAILAFGLLGVSALPAQAGSDATNVVGTPGNAQVALSWSAPTSNAFPFTFNGNSYNSVYVGSNSYLTFGSGSSQYSSLAANSPAIPGVHICAADNSYQRVQYLINESVTPNQLRIRYEGTASTGGTAGAPNIIYEAVFYKDQSYFDLLIGTHARCVGGTRFVTNGSTAIASPGFAASTNWRINGATVTQNGNTAAWLGSSSGTTAPSTLGYTSMFDSSADDSYLQVPLAPTGYAIRYSSNGGTNWTQFSSNTNTTATTATVTGLTNGTSYIFQVAPFFASTGTTGSYSVSSATVIPNGAVISYGAGTGGSGTAPASPTTTTIGSTFTTPANTYVRNGYSFAGWSDGSSVYAAGARYPATGTVTGNVTLTATWTPNANTVTFNSNYSGGPTATTQSINTGIATALTANAFSRTGYTFAGWNTLANGTGTKYTDGQSVTISAPLTLYAIWYRLAITTQPVGKASGTTLQTQPVVRIEDGSGATVTTDSTTSITAAISSGTGGTLGGTQVVTVTNGVATFSNLTLAGTAGTNYVLSFTSSPSYNSVQSQNVTVTPGSVSAANSTVIPGTATFSADGVTTQTFTVTLKDAQGNTLTSTNDTVTFARSNSLGTFGSTTNKSPGVYEGVYTAGTSPGTDTITVTANSVVLTTKPVITLNPGVPSTTTSLVTASSGSITANGTSTSIITVRLKDAAGNNIPIGGATVTLRVLSGTGSVGSVTDNGNGTYTATYTSSTSAGSAQLQATVGGADIAAGETITLVPGTPSKLGVLTQPNSTTSSGSVFSSQPRIAVQDAFGNTVTTDPSRSITLGLVGSNGSLGGTLIVNTSSGVATFSGISLAGLTSNNYRLSFTASGLTAVNSDLISVTPGNPSTATSVVTASVNSLVANGASTSTITVTLKDAQSNLLTSASGNIVVSIFSGPGSISSTTNNNDGTYTATFTSPISVGTTVIQAKIDSIPISDTESIASLPGAATQIALTRFPVSGASGSTLPTQPQITLRDANNNTVTSNNSSTVDVAISSGANGTLSGTTQVTFTNGVANFTNLALTGRTGISYVLQFTSGSFTADSSNLNLTPGAASVSTSTVIATDSTLTANGLTSTTITVRLKDAQTNALTASGGTVSLAVSSGTGSVSAVTNNGDGTYTATYTSGTVVGTATLTASLNSVAITDTESINLVHGSASKIRITQQPTGTASGTNLGTQPIVEITDANNNRVTTDSSTIVSVGIGSGSGGTIGGTTTATVSSGLATFTDLSLAGLVGQNYKFRFTSGSLALADSNNISVTPGAAVSSTSVISASATTMTANGTSTSIVTVQLKDAQGNLRTTGGSTVTMRVHSGAGSIGSVTDNGNGTYSATYTSGTTSGSVVIKAALSGSDLTAVQTLALNPGSATKLGLLIAPGSSSSGSLLSPQPQIVVQDVNGNTVTSDSGRVITVAISAGTGGSLTGTRTATTANGVAQFSDLVLAGLTTSNYVLSFTTPSLTQVSSGTLSVTTGSPQVSTSSFNLSNSSIVANGVTTSTVTITLRDAQSNALVTSGGTVQMSISPGHQGTISGTVDNNDGTYTATYTSGTVVSDAVITAKLNGVSLTHTATISLIPGPATQLRIVTQPTGKASGTTLDHQPVIELLDAFGNRATQDSSSQVTAELYSGLSGSLGGTRTLAASQGVATFTNLTLAGLVSESYVLRFTSGSLTLADSANIAVTPGAATTLSIASGDNTSATVNTNVATKPSVSVQDAQGNFVPNVIVSFTTGANSGIATGTSVTTNASGSATVGSWKLNTIAGSNSLTASATGTNSVTFHATGIAAAPDATKSSIALATNTVVVAGAPVGITVTIRDTYNNVVTDAAGILVLSPTSGLGTISTPVNNNNGTYSAVFTPATRSGTETISGNYYGSALTDQSLSVTPSIATQYLMSRTAGTIVAGNAITISAQLADQYSNAVSTSGSVVTWSATNGGLFASASSTTNSSGLATVSYTTNTVVSNSAAVTATDSSGITGTLTSFATVPGVAVVGTSVVESSASSLVANGSTTSTITVTLKDANGNRLTAASPSTVTIFVGMSVGTVGSTINNGDGTYSATYTSRTSVGTATISATLGVATITDTAIVSLIPGPATKVQITTQPVGSASGTALATQPVAKLLDAYNNVVTGDESSTISVAIQSGFGGSLGGNQTVTVVHGVGTFTNLTLAGLVNTNYVLRFTSGALVTADSSNVLVTPGAPSIGTSTVTTTVNSLVADSSNSTTVTVTLKDAQGNQLVTGGLSVGITVASLSVGSSDYGTVGSVTDNNNGTYTATYSAGTKVQDVRFSATLAGNSLSDDAALALGHGTATKIAVQIQPTGGGSGSVLGTQPVVLIQDAHGNTVTNDSGRTVTAGLGGQQNSGTLSGARTSVSDHGVVTFSGIVMTGRTSTNYVLAFSASGLTSATSNNFTVNPGPTNTTNSVVSAANAVITANGITASVITVTVKDSEGNTVRATAGTVLLSVASGTGSLSPVVDNNDGTYTSTFTSGTVAGSATIAGTLNGASLGTSAGITLTPGPAHHTAVLVQPGDTASGALLSPQAQVLIQDRYNNTVTADSSTVVTARLKSGANGSVGGTLTATASAGVATFVNVTLSGIVGNDYVIEFDPNTSGVASVDSRTINVTPGTPTQLVLTTPAVSANSGQAFVTQPVLVAKDAQDNVATNFTANVNATVSSGANTQGTTAQQLVNGVATFNDLGLYGAANSNYTLTYTTSSLGLTTSQSLLLNPGSADHLEIITQPTSEMNGRVFLTQPIIQIRDAQNNAVPTSPGVNVVAAISSGTGALSGTQTVASDLNGRSTFTNLMITGNTGNYRVTFTAGGLSVETSPIAIGAGDQTITRSSFDSTPLPNGTYTPTATSYSGLPVAITLDNSSRTICSISHGEVTFIKSGDCKINFDQPGNTHWSAAPRVVETLSVGRLPQNIEFAAIYDQPFGGTDVALSATADSGLTVTFAVSSPTTVCTLATATTIHIVGLGTCTVNVSQSGDDVWLSASNNDGNHPLARSFEIGTVRPATPTIASVSAGNAQATVSWNPPSHNGGSPILDYKVTAHPGGATCVSNNASESSCIVSGLTNGTEYRFTVQARNAVGLSNSSENSPAITPATTADAVTGLTLTSTNRKLTAEWINPAQLGGGSFVRYEMFIRESGGNYGNPFVSRNANLESFEFTKTDPNDSGNSSDLRNGESYDVKIVIITDAIMSGNGSAVELLGNSTEATQIPADVPTAPTDVVILTTTGHEANVSWVASNGDGGAAITAYEVTATANNGSVTCMLVTPLDTSCAIAALTPGHRIEVSVRAVNRIGRSDRTTAILELPTVPDAATMNTVTVGNGFIHVEWSAPASDGGMALTGYIARAMIRGTDQVAAECTTAGTGCDLMLTGVDYDFDFAVWASNRVGTSARSNLVSPAKPAPSPTPSPSGTRMRAPTNSGAAAVVWDSRKPLYLPSGEPIELQAGKSKAWSNGDVVDVNLVAAGTSVLQLSAAGGVVLQMQSLNLSGKPMDVSASGLMQVYHSRTMRIAGSGFAPNSMATIWMFSKETKIGEVMTDANGAFSEVFPITDSIPLGDHTLQINGEHKDGSVKTVAMGVTVMGEAFAPAEVDASDPNTGNSNQLLGVIGAVGLAFVGGLAVGLLTISQRRRKL